MEECQHKIRYTLNLTIYNGNQLIVKQDTVPANHEKEYTVSLFRNLSIGKDVIMEIKL